MDHYALMLLVAVLPFVCARWTDDQYDHFTFAQSWPPGVCADAPREHHTCHVDKQVTTWTIHGLWPTQGSEIPHGPHDCNGSLKFDFSKLASLQKDLTTFWPNLYTDTELDSFCPMSGPNTAHMLRICQKLRESLTISARDWNQKYDMLKMLTAGGVTPSPTAQYSYHQFMDAVRQSTGFDPNIVCSYIKLENGYQLHIVREIELCLSKTDFTPVACPGSEVSVKGGNQKSTKGGNQSGSKPFRAQSNCHYPPIQYVLNTKTGMFELPNELVGR